MSPDEINSPVLLKKQHVVSKLKGFKMSLISHLRTKKSPEKLCEYEGLMS